MRRAIAVLALMTLALPAVAAEPDRCLTEVRQLTAKSVTAGYPPILAINYLAAPTPEDCSKVLDYVSAWWADVTVEVRDEPAASPSTTTPLTATASLTLTTKTFYWPQPQPF